VTTEDAVRSRGLYRARDYVRRLPGGALAWRIMISVVGAAVIAVGIVLLPLPGPGWLIIFLGLGLWATEFAWAANLLRWVRARVMSWTHWIMRQPRWLQFAVSALGLAFTVAVTIGCWYLLR
jgi:uncharacterized protein (TIGR02611 family)